MSTFHSFSLMSIYCTSTMVQYKHYVTRIFRTTLWG